MVGDADRKSMAAALVKPARHPGLFLRRQAAGGDELDLDLVDRVLDDMELPDARNLGVEHISEEGPGPPAVRADQHVSGSAQAAGAPPQTAAHSAGGSVPGPVPPRSEAHPVGQA